MKFNLTSAILGALAVVIIGGGILFFSTPSEQFLGQTRISGMQIGESGLTVTGDTSIRGDIEIVDTASSTAVIGSLGASNNSGCLAIGDSSATGTLVYITASGSTVSATTTKPAICK